VSFLQSSSHGSPHHFLASLKGGWTGKTHTWFDPDAPAVEAPSQGSIQLILDGRFAIYIYESRMEDEPQHGMFTFGYNTTLERYEASWVDNIHNNAAIMFCTGAPKPDGFWVLGSYPDPTGGPDWGWRTELETTDPEHLTISAYNISPEGSEALAVETILTRVMPR